jgi:hypothetical protein
VRQMRQHLEFCERRLARLAASGDSKQQPAAKSSVATRRRILTGDDRWGSLMPSGRSRLRRSHADTACPPLNCCRPARNSRSQCLREGSGRRRRLDTRCLAAPDSPRSRDASGRRFSRLSTDPPRRRRDGDMARIRVEWEAQRRIQNVSPKPKSWRPIWTYSVPADGRAARGETVLRVLFPCSPWLPSLKVGREEGGRGTGPMPLAIGPLDHLSGDDGVATDDRPRGGVPLVKPHSCHYLRRCPRLRRPARSAGRAAGRREEWGQ